MVGLSANIWSYNLISSNETTHKYIQIHVLGDRIPHASRVRRDAIHHRTKVSDTMILRYGSWERSISKPSVVQ